MVRLWQVLTLTVVALGLTMGLMREQGSAFSWALAGAVLVTLAFVAWLALVQPVNSEAGAVMKANPQALPAAWVRLRTRWEYGHAVAFGIHLLGFIALATAIVSSFSGRRA